MARRKRSEALAVDANFEESDSRARDENRATDRRVMRCVQLMATGRWERGGMAEEMAKEWGVSLSTVANVSAEASRFLRMAKTPEALLQYVLSELQGILEGYEDPAVKLGAAKVIIDGLKAMGAKGTGPVAEKPYVVGPTELLETLVAELSAPGPELAEALDICGYRRVLDVVGEDSGGAVDPS